MLNTVLDAPERLAELLSEARSRKCIRGAVKMVVQCYETGGRGGLYRFLQAGLEGRKGSCLQEGERTLLALTVKYVLRYADNLDYLSLMDPLAKAVASLTDRLDPFEYPLDR